MPKSEKTLNDRQAAPDTKASRLRSPMIVKNSNTPEIRVLLIKESPFFFGYGSFSQHVELISHLEAVNWECIYVLEGREDDKRIVREGRIGDLRAHLPAYLNTSEYGSLDRIAILTGPWLWEDDVKAAVYLISRQIQAVGGGKQSSKRLEIPNVDDRAWCKGRDAFLAFREGEDLFGIGFLGPRDLASDWNCVDAMRDR